MIRELRQTNSMLAVAARLGRLGGWWYDLDAERVGWSDEVKVIHDVAADFEPTVETAIDFYVPEHRPVITEALVNLIGEGTPYDLEAEIVTATGRRRWCRTIGEAERDDDGRIVRLAGAFQDIHEQKLGQLALRESEERFRLLSEATSDVVFDWDVAGARVWYGDGLEELVGDDGHGIETIAEAEQRIHPGDLARVTERLRRLLEGTDVLWMDEFSVLHADGRVVPVMVNGSLIRDDTGVTRRVIGSLVDMTQERQMQERLEQSRRLEALGQLTGGIAHDFNNLLTVIMGNADLLAEDLQGHRDQLELVELTRLAAERGAELTRRLLAYARRQPLEPMIVDVGDLVAGFLPLLRRSLGEHVEIDVRVHDELSPAMVDPSQLESALFNVCLNSRDAMPGGGRLTIELSTARLDHDDASLHDMVPGAYVLIAVTDTGLGMDADLMERAFEPFFTTKAAGAGSGLGLSMVFGFARQSYGHVHLDSAVGVGTTVRLYLPAATSRREDSAAGHEAMTTRRGDERILLVEDDEQVRAVAAAQLRSLGYTVVDAASGPEAVVHLRTGPPFALLFTDVIMPGGMNGRELADAARAVDPDLPVLFTSGYTEDTIVHHGRLDPGVELLTKPYRRDELAERVRRILDVSGR